MERARAPYTLLHGRQGLPCRDVAVLARRDRCPRDERTCRIASSTSAALSEAAWRVSHSQKWRYLRPLPVYRGKHASRRLKEKPITAERSGPGPVARFNGDHAASALHEAEAQAVTTTECAWKECSDWSEKRIGIRAVTTRPTCLDQSPYIPRLPVLSFFVKNGLRRGGGFIRPVVCM